ncbi:4-(cytidine 5'-diphospho)-2-C-methyl-D-erythritol kinase [Candidatus Pelagibacter sp.]|nr:4-(cytidine 5'-diphospho)-2-C-methyl-D-erythritol kinase [Candidatus Pelagibacter sp.]
MDSFNIKSYAKINLALNVIGKKKKLHKIESLISFIYLHDLINLKLIKKNNHKVIFKGEFSKNIGKINTVTNLLQLLDKKNLLNNKKFEIKILKNIPQKAGLGGGSMNAASLINFFINKKILKIKKDELTKLTRKIGSDVILGIKPINTILSHNGDLKKYNKDIKFYTLVVKPDFGCSTKYIYSKVKAFSKPQFNLPKLKMFDIKYLKTLNNDLEKIAFKRHPKLKEIKLFLLGTSNNIFVRMSGSGSSIVAYFNSKRACGNAYRQFKRKFSSHWCIISKTI